MKRAIRSMRRVARREVSVNDAVRFILAQLFFRPLSPV